MLVHISTLDAYASSRGEKAAYELASRWRKAVLAWDGPVVVIDQKWPPRPEISRPRYNFVRRIELARDIMFVHQGDLHDLNDVLPEIAEDLEKIGVEQVVLGGLWYGRDGGFGAVAEAMDYLKKEFEVSVDRSLVADADRVSR